MRISFDLDDTLICYGEGVPQEPRLSLWWRFLVGDEPLRAGARGLMTHLHQCGYELWIYTTSHRPPGGVRRWLWCHGIRVAGVINQDVHDHHLRRSRDDYPPSKNPRAFGIELHIDDSDGVRMEGEQYGFSVVVIDPGDTGWTQKVLQGVEKMHRLPSNRA